MTLELLFINQIQYRNTLINASKNHWHELHPRNQRDTHYLRWVNLNTAVRHVSLGTCHVGHCLVGLLINQCLPLTATVAEGLM